LQLTELIKSSSIALRLTAGSDEAGYLAQIFPLPQAPTVVIIKNGELKEYITPGVTKDDFVRRVQGAFNAQTRPSTSDQAATSTAEAPAPQAEATTDTTPQESNRSDNVRRILAERAARMQAQKEEAERKAKEERTKAKEKAKAEAEAGADTDAARTHKQAELLKKRKQKENDERKRILKRIEDDKAERRERAAERQRQRADNQKIGDVAASLVNAPESKLPSTTKLSDMTALQVRLFDGSTIRSRFKTASPMKEVRKWVDESRNDGKLPYTFKQVLTPLPNKNIDETEEDQDIGELGLSPSSTLVLIPVTKYSSAYDDRPRNIFSRFIGILLRFFTWLLSLIGLGGDARGEHRHSSSSGTTADRDGSRVQAFQNSNDRRRDQQLYNGNSVSLETDTFLLHAYESY
jgi:hypothetical protein